MTKLRVLFLCTGNSARSQMAEAFLRAHGGERFEAFSAGLEPGVINPYTYQVMAESGLDLSGQTSKGLDTYLGKASFDYLITVCDQADQRCPFFPGMGARLHWSFEDPAAFDGPPEAELDKFRQVRDEIERRVVGWIGG